MLPPMAKRINIVTPTYNEEANVREVYAQAKTMMAQFPHLEYEHIFIDNASTDRTESILREMAAADPNVKVILNARNFGHIRSPHYGILQSTGDATIYMVADLQDPPDVAATFIREWEKGAKIVLGVKTKSDETFLLYFIRSIYYSIVTKLSGTKLIKHYTGFGLYDRKVIDVLKKIDDPYPYFRGMVMEIGFDPVLITYHQPVRKRGVTKQNAYTLYDLAMLGITTHSKIPLRIATMLGFFLSFVSFLIAVAYLVLKIFYWDSYAMGMASLIISSFIFFSLQLFFIGLLGEYIASIHTQVLRRPLVVEKERINF